MIHPLVWAGIEKAGGQVRPVENGGHVVSFGQGRDYHFNHRGEVTYHPGGYTPNGRGDYMGWASESHKAVSGTPNQDMARQHAANALSHIVPRKPTQKLARTIARVLRGRY
jgi:hypothetical protein